MRRFAADRLDGSDVRRRLANWMVELAEAAETHWLASGDQVEWLDRIGDELDDVRSALRWSLDTGHVQTALRLASALRTFWEVRGHFPEGGRWIEEALAHDGDVPPRIRRKALGVPGTIAFRTGDLTRAGEHYEEGLALWRELDDHEGVARARSATSAPSPPGSASSRPHVGCSVRARSCSARSVRTSASRSSFRTSDMSQASSTTTRRQSR